jgi:anaphase-promoting complex subunit 6
MSDNVDVLAVRAGRLFASLDFDECARLTRAILERDPFVEDRVTVVHLAALVELDERHELFVLAHRLVDSGPRRGISWMAVGYYYFACGKYELARRYLQKATGVDPRLGPAWLASGHAFAAQDESDQAMAAYRTASRLFPGAQLPLLFMGMEYARQSSPVHATSFFQSAREACLSDPAPRHELGVIAYRSGDLPAAVAYFKAALSLWEASDGLKDFVSHGGRRAEAEEATLFNLGHCYRRLREFERAKQCYERALSLRPRSASTCCALGMTLHALGDHPSAVAMYHRALRHNPEDTMSVVGLDRALHDMTTTSPV